MPQQPGPDSDLTRLPTGTAARTFSAGDLLSGRFRVVRFIARGGMGELYEAHDEELGERVALKTIRRDVASDERVVQRFRREVQLARKVTHPNICRIFDLFQHAAAPGPAAGPSVLFVTMELLDGETLADRLKRIGPFSAPDARPLVAQMAAALSAAHAAGIVHRDFKSNNIMLLEPERAGGPPRVVVTDFGLAYRFDSHAHEPISATGDMVGTLDYMAPEQIEGGTVTPATDIYALGLVVYEMVTGQRPFAAETPVASALRRLSAPPAPPRRFAADLPRAWDRAIMRCLARDARDRFHDAAQVLEALEQGDPAAPWWRRRAPTVAAAALLVVCAGAVAWFALEPAPGAGSGGPPAAAASAARPAVAVLGFRNLNDREDARWLSTALSEMLTTELAAGETVRTIPGENVTRMKAELALSDADSYSADTLARIRNHLDTDLVVFGSYLALGDGDGSTLRVDIRLQDSREGRTVSQVSETARMGEMFDLVSRVGTRLREQLGGDAIPDAVALARAARPGSPEAARLYTEGLVQLRRFDALGARRSLEGAIQADSQFALAHAALATTWSSLGYDNRAREAAARAFELAGDLPRVDRLQVEGTLREMSSAWKEAIVIWQALVTLFPDDVEHVLRLAGAQTESGAPRDGLDTIEAFRRRFPTVTDPRLDLAEAAAAETLSDFPRMRAAAAAAAAAARAQGAQLLLAGARMREAVAMLRQGELDAAVSVFEEARRLYADAGDRAGVARALNNVAAAISDGPDPRRTMALYEEALAMARAIGDQDQVARVLNNLAIQERRAGNLQTSLTMNQHALAIRREIGDRTNEAISLNNIGNVLLDIGDLQGASRHYEQSAEMSREIGDQRSVARALHNASEALKLQGQVARARTTIEEALSIRRTIDDPASVATSLFGLGSIASAQGDLATARRSLVEALEMDRRLNRRRPMAYSLYELGETALVEGDLAGARRYHQEALDIRTQLGERGTAAESRVALARLALEEGRPEEAEILARDAATVFAGQAALNNEAVARATVALAMLAQGQHDAALREAGRAQALVSNSQYALARIPVEIAAARIGAVRNPAAAVRALDAIVRDAAERGIPRSRFEARRAMAEAESGRSQTAGAALTAALRKEARTLGFGLYAR